MADNATIARPYARAVFERANTTGKLALWGELLAKATVVITDARIAPLLGNPHVKRADLVALVIEVSEANDMPAENFIRLLADNSRLALLPEIAAQYEALRADVENTVDVTVTSALALTAEQSTKLAKALTARLNRTVRLHTTVDAGLVGGAIVRAGDFVVDGSLRGRIDRLAIIMAGA